MVVDIIIAILLCFGFLIGFKRGFTRQLVSLIGMILVIILSFIFKNPVSIFMYKHFPFFSFKGISALNILLYEVISFVLVFSILSIVLRIIMMLTKVFEKVLNMTILLGIPSKILGGIGGVIENYLIIFIALYFFNLPIFNFDLKDTKLANFILNTTPVMSSVCDKTLAVIEDFNELKIEYKDMEDIPSMNEKAISLFIKYDIISDNNVKYLEKIGKL